MSVAPQPARLPLHVDSHQPEDVELNEVSGVHAIVWCGHSILIPWKLGDLQDALEPFAKCVEFLCRCECSSESQLRLIRRSGRSVRLHCTVPTACWSSSPTCACQHWLRYLNSDIDRRLSRL